METLSNLHEFNPSLNMDNTNSYNSPNTLETSNISDLPNLDHLSNIPEINNKNYDINEKSFDNDDIVGVSSIPNTPTISRLSKGSSIFATFTDGSSFRNIIEYTRLVNIEGIFKFSRDQIVFEKDDEYGDILNIITIDISELTDYEYISDHKEIVIGINIADLRDRIKDVGKKDHIDIYILPDEPDNLYIRVKSQSAKDASPQAFMIPIESYEVKEYDLPQFDRRLPTCTIHQNDFSRLCKSFVNIKCKNVKIHGFEKGILCKGYLYSGKMDAVKEFGNCSNDKRKSKNLKSFYNTGLTKNITKSNRPTPKLNIGERGEVEHFTIETSIIKYLLKLNALSPQGTVKIYIQKGLPFKLVCNVGTFGKLNVYLMG